MLDPTYPLLPVFFFLSFVLVLIPLPWHLQAWNVGTCSYMIWTAIACLNQFVNSIVWANDAINRSPVWCDISSRIIIATAVAIPCSSLTITRRLYKIAKTQTVVADPKEKRRDMIIDLLVCVGFPLFEIVLYYFVEGHRFDILEQIGCFPVTINTAPAYPLVIMWPVVLGLISFGFGFLSLKHFLRRRREMSQFLSTNASITSSRYFRLMCLSTLDTLLTLPLGLFSMVINLTENEIAPWKGLADVHFGFSRVDQVPAILWKINPVSEMSLYLNRWLVVFCGLLFFGFFGFAEEARKNYKKIFWIVAKRFGYEPKAHASTFAGSSFIRTPNLPTISTNSNNNGGLKVFINRDDKVKRDSFLSSIGDLDSSITVDETYEERKDAKSHAESSDSFASSPDDIELPALPNIISTEPRSQRSSLVAPPRPPRPTSLGDDIV